MAISVIKSRNFVIEDKEILAIINNANIQYLNLTIKKDYDNCIIICANIGPEEKSKACMKIFKESSYFIRTPSTLVPFTGKKVFYYRDDTVFKDPNELFRIKPVNFEIYSDKFKDTDCRDVPYFTKSGSLVLPRIFINQHFNHRIVLCKLSFDCTDAIMIKNGVICCYFYPYNEKHYFSFNIKKNYMGLTTGIMKKLIETVDICDKDISRFEFRDISFSENYKNGFITFTEKKNANKFRR